MVQIQSPRNKRRVISLPSPRSASTKEGIVDSLAQFPPKCLRWIKVEKQGVLVVCVTSILFLFYMQHAFFGSFESNAKASKITIPLRRGASLGKISIDSSKIKNSIIISVITSRAEFLRRVTSIEATWAKNLPDNMRVVYMVGEEEDTIMKGLQTTREQDITSLFNKASPAPNIDLSRIHIMKGVLDDEYPPVLKTQARTEIIAKIGTDFDWHFFVDDDTYVNIPVLQRFLETHPAAITPNENDIIYGCRGFGRADIKERLLQHWKLTKGFCLGGPGFIMSQHLVQNFTQSLDSCIQEYIEPNLYKDDAWHSDVMIGICIQQATTLGCWDWTGYTTNNEDDLQLTKKLFRHDYSYQNEKLLPKFLKSLKMKQTISAHPFKDGMDGIHEMTRKATANFTQVDRSVWTSKE